LLKKQKKQRRFYVKNEEMFQIMRNIDLQEINFGKKRKRIGLGLN
jgi:hypothetical protein